MSHINLTGFEDNMGDRPSEIVPLPTPAPGMTSTPQLNDMEFNMLRQMMAEYQSRSAQPVPPATADAGASAVGPRNLNNQLENAASNDNASYNATKELAKLTDASFKEETCHDKDLPILDETQRLCIRFGPHQNICFAVMVLQNHQLWCRWDNDNHQMMNKLYMAFNDSVLKKLPEVIAALPEDRRVLLGQYQCAKTGKLIKCPETWSAPTHNTQLQWGDHIKTFFTEACNPNGVLHGLRATVSR